MNSIPLQAAVRCALLGFSTLAAGPAVGQETAREGQAEPTVLEDIEVVGRQRSAADDILQERIDAAVVQDAEGAVPLHITPVCRVTVRCGSLRSQVTQLDP
jgi:hypothetical protein